jgi:SH3-like domain-containing protein
MSKIILLLLFFFTSNLFASEAYFLTLRNDEVNLRQGPSFDYPIKIIYKKKYLPVLIEDKSNNFKKIRDHENNTGWIHVSQLSKTKAGINNVDELIVFKKPTLYSKPLVVLSKGRLCFIKKCKNKWCKIETGEFIGWIMKKNLWGRL